MIYTCESCHFTFSRVGECEQCPDCGKKAVREATEEEKDEFYRYREESKKHPLSAKDFE